MNLNGAKKLIVNADGFGFGAGATQGIFDAIKEGKFITSVSVNANFPEAERVQELVSEYPDISIGVHLNPMAGKPCLPPSQVRSLIGKDGFFHESKFPVLLRKGLISIDELEVEFDAQILRIRELTGDRITHLDSQENTHMNYFSLFLKLAHKWDIRCIRNNASRICLEAQNPFYSQVMTYMQKPHVWMAHQYRKYQMHKARAQGMRMADALITVGYAGTGNKTNPENWERVIDNVPDGTYEIYCHPAYPDEVMNRWTVYCEQRAEELEILRRERLADLAEKSGIRLISFNDI